MSANPSYTRLREDLLALVKGDYASVLDVGCAEGSNGASLAAARPGARVVGIEIDPETAKVAASRLSEVLVGDAAAQLAALDARGDHFDLVILGDVLEHLVDPWAALATVRRLCPRGAVLVSLPNVAHVTTLLTVALRGYWPYRDRGIHDRTHLRFFGRANLEELFEGAGFRLEELRVRYRVAEEPTLLNQVVNRLTEPVLRHLPGVRRPFAYQFLCRLA